MGSCLPPPTIKIESYARLASQRIKPSYPSKSKPQSKKPIDPYHQKLGQGLGEKKSPAMEERRNEVVRVPLSEVVSDCIKRWFQDTLKEARNGDQAMQVLVGQMYQSGYGIPKNEQKAKAWMAKASKYRSSVWKVSDKRPGYNASDSDSDEVKDDQH